MKKLSLLTVVPALFIATIATSTQARDIHKDHPIYKSSDLFCVKFEHKKEPFCTATKIELTQESDYDAYRDVMRMKRQLQNTNFNRSIVDVFVDNRLTVLEYQFLKSEAHSIEPKIAAKMNIDQKNSQ